MLEQAQSIVHGLPFPLLVVAPTGAILAANPMAEALFGASAGLLRRSTLARLFPFSSPILAMVDSARDMGASVAERRLLLRLPQSQEDRVVDVHAGPLGAPGGDVLLIIQEQTLADKLDRQLSNRNSARSVSTLSTMLAHEIKNPLSGISGAAQLLEGSVGDEDRPLTRLIKEETERIVRLVDRMEVFSDLRPPQISPLNIHTVLAHVKAVATSGFADHIAFAEVYDPSLPPIAGNRDLLIQVFLNLVKNAAEAIGPAAHGGEITLTSAFKPGMRITGHGARGRTSLPLEIGVHDNGGGVPDDLLPRLFDPFVTTKPQGSGLGLALVAKIIGDHGGSIMCETKARRTSFLVYLPIADVDIVLGEEGLAP